MPEARARDERYTFRTEGERVRCCTIAVSIRCGWRHWRSSATTRPWSSLSQTCMRALEGRGGRVPGWQSAALESYGDQYQEWFAPGDWFDYEHALWMTFVRVDRARLQFNR